MRRWTMAAILLSLGVLPACEARAQGVAELDRDDELRLAMSAGPPSVSSRADLYVLGDRGFEKAVSGDNGWACIVERSSADDRMLAPHCLNPHAVTSVLPAFLVEGELQRKGWAQDEISAELVRRFESGALDLPSGPAYAYMLSGGQRLGSSAGRFQPHFMLYIPYVTNASIGGDPAEMRFPFVGPVENHPLSTVVILMDEFVEPADMEIPAP